MSKLKKKEQFISVSVQKIEWKALLKFPEYYKY